MGIGIFSVIVFVLGLASGIVIVRYGFGLGVKAVYQIREDLPISEPKPTEEDTWQERTSDEPDEEEIIS